MATHPIDGERDLWRLWAGRQLPSGLVTRDGRALRVLFPGRENAGAGPDFIGALLGFESDAALRGDVELHLKASSWTAHGHHLDPRYAGVILHVVLLDDGGPARTVADRPIPVLALGPLLGRPAADHPATGPCADARAALPGPDVVRNAVRAAGHARFEARAAQWEGELAARSAEDCMLQALLRAAGLGRNGEACAALAAALDGATLEAVLAAAGADRCQAATAALLGMAGLLEQARAGDDVRAAWERHRHDWPGRPLQAREWQRFRLRPANLPEARLRLVAALLGAHGLRGLLTAMIELVEGEPPPAPARLVALLASDGAGRSWALEAWTNVLLPLLAGFGQARGREGLTARAVALNEGLPGGGDNRILARMVAIAGLSETPRLAIDQQGLLEIWSRHCGMQACATCPLRVVPA